MSISSKQLAIASIIVSDRHPFIHNFSYRRYRIVFTKFRQQKIWIRYFSDHIQRICSEVSISFQENNYWCLELYIISYYIHVLMIKDQRLHSYFILLDKERSVLLRQWWNMQTELALRCHDDKWVDSWWKMNKHHSAHLIFLCFIPKSLYKRNMN